MGKLKKSSAVRLSGGGLKKCGEPISQAAVKKAKTAKKVKFLKK